MASTSAAEMPATSWDEHVKRTQDRLHSMYMTHVKPLEDRYKYDAFKPSWFEETIVNSKPFVTFFGPWSAGKSTFINYLLQSNFVQTGPHPTTAEFTVMLYGEEPGPLDGRVVANAKDLPFKGLNEFGESFLNAFQGYQVKHDLLKSITLVDTPGVLESAKDIHQRKYDYIKLSRWFAERSDLVFVMFDPTKLDAGQEMRMLFRFAFKGQESKIRIVLNKSDTVNTQELLRVYGSLFWNLSNMVDSTEPPRVYVGSFWDQPYQPGTFHRLFSEEKTDLVHELTTLVPSQALDKKIASLIRRAKEVFVHSIIVGGMRSGLPMFFGKDKAKQKAIDELPKTYERVAAQHKMNWRDFPPVEDYRSFLSKFDLETFPEIEKVEKEGLLNGIRHLIDTLLPRMIRPVKTAPVADPRDKEGRKELTDAYNQGIRDQFLGKAGIQGSSDLTQTAIRQSAVADLAPAMPQGPAAAMGMNGMGMMNPAMMAMLMQQQQQQNQNVPTIMGSPSNMNGMNNGMGMMGMNNGMGGMNGMGNGMNNGMAMNPNMGMMGNGMNNGMAMNNGMGMGMNPAMGGMNGMNNGMGMMGMNNGMNAAAPTATPAATPAMGGQNDMNQQMQQMMQMMQQQNMAHQQTLPQAAPTPAPAPTAAPDASNGGYTPDQMQQMMLMMQQMQMAGQQGTVAVVSAPEDSD